MRRGLKNSIITGVFLLVCIVVFCHFRFQDPLYFVKFEIEVQKIALGLDKNKNEVDDAEDILAGARGEVKNKTNYKSAYYEGGYPPDNEGVCTDVVWRALDEAGYNLKSAMDKDIKENTKDYAEGVIKPDPNIDFRRVKNQSVFFKKYAKELPLEVVPFDKENLVQWQGGDIVVMKGVEHVAIISDKRRKDGVPYVIHNAKNYPKEEDRLMYWYKKGRIIGHYRLTKQTFQ